MSKAIITPWRDSLAIKKLRAVQKEKKLLCLAFLDIDATLTGHPDDQKELRQQLEERGYVIMFLTARTSELCLSWQAREKSSVDIKKRPKAKLELDETTGKLREVDPVTLPSMQGILDPDILGSSLGGELLVKQESGGYEIDRAYAQAIPYKPTIWGDYGARLIDQLKIGIGTLSPAALLTNYLEGKVGIAPPESLVQVFFKTKEEMNVFVTTMQQLQQRETPPPGYDHELFQMLKATLMTDDSDPYNPQAASYSVFLTHKTVHKLAAMDRAIEMLTKILGETKAQFEVLVAGDAASDVRMGLYGGQGTRATFIIPGNARLARYIAENDTAYIGSEFADLKQQLKPVTDKPGYYTFSKNNKTVIIGDEAFPGTRGPETLLAWLERNHV